MTFDDITNDGRLWAILVNYHESFNMEASIVRLKEYASPTPSRWREEAEFRRENKAWLLYSQMIAVKMLDRMEVLGISQQALASRMGCSQQYISKILKGRENLSLETVSKIESALDMHLINIVDD